MPNTPPEKSGRDSSRKQDSEQRIGYYILGIGLFFCGVILVLVINSYGKLMEKIPRKPANTPVEVVAEASANTPARQISERQTKLELIRTKFGSESAQFAENLHDMAAFYQQKGMSDEAESHYRQAVDLWDKVIKSDQVHSAKSMTSLGMLYSGQNRSTEAEPLLVRATTIWNQNLDAVDPVAKAGLETLATLYENTGRLEEATRLRQKASQL